MAIATALILLTGGRAKTDTAKALIRISTIRRKTESAEIQKALDEEHSRGFGFSAYDGRRIDYQPYTGADQQTVCGSIDNTTYIRNN